MSTYSADGTGYNPSQAWTAGTFNQAYVSVGATDSASAITAMMTGFKNNDGQINWSTDGKRLTTFAEMSKWYGRAAASISTVEWVHATPAGVYAHNSNRNNYSQIAIEGINSSMDVIFGAGNPDYNDNGLPASKSTSYVGGNNAWNKLKNNFYPGLTHVQSRSEFLGLAIGDPSGRYIGTFQTNTTSQQARSGYSASDTPGSDPLNGNVPSLSELSLAALNILDNNPNGLFLMIEGGAIDWANHANQAARLIEEQNDFNKAVESVIGWVEASSGWDETLLIVTGDHECGLITGPGGSLNVVDNGAGVMPGMEYHSGGHTNMLIPMFAKGAGAEMFAMYATGSDPIRGAYIDNTDVFKVMAGSTGIVPEPASLTALGVGIAGFAGMVAQRKR